MDYTTIKLIEDGNVATITLNRPERRNAINPVLAEEMTNCIGYCSTNANIRAIVLTGEGSVFCSGGDVLEIVPSKSKELLNTLNPMLLELRRVPKPVIAAVNGPAIGGGFAVALACDLVIAAKSARFNAHWVRIGMSSDCGMSYTLPRLLGDKRTAWLMFTGDMIDAQEGYRLGFVNKVVEDDQLMMETYAVAKRLAESATMAIASIKQLLDRTWNETMESQMELEKQLIARLTLMEDHNEAIAAFREKRKPKFKGR